MDAYSGKILSLFGSKSWQRRTELGSARSQTRAAKPECSLNRRQVPCQRRLQATTVPVSSSSSVPISRVFEGY